MVICDTSLSDSHFLWREGILIPHQLGRCNCHRKHIPSWYLTNHVMPHFITKCMCLQFLYYKCMYFQLHCHYYPVCNILNTRLIETAAIGVRVHFLCLSSLIILQSACEGLFCVLLHFNIQYERLVSKECSKLQSSNPHFQTITRQEYVYRGWE